MHTLESNYFAMTKEFVSKKMVNLMISHFHEKSWDKKLEIKRAYFDFAEMDTKLFFLRKSKEDYIKCCKVIYGGMSICLLIYYLFPNGLSLRQPLEDKNICCMIVNQLRSADTPANVCPSIHVSSTIGILFVLFHSEKLKNYRKLKATMLVLGTFICISTVVIDQHSVVDAVCGMMLSAVLFYLVQLSEVPDQVTVFEEVKR